MFHAYNNVALSALRLALPPQVVSIDDELEYYGNSIKKVERIRRMIGTDKRRVANRNVTASDLCAYAAEDIFKDKPHLKKEIDALIFVTQTPDYKMPATACILQEKLGLPTTCASFDVNQGCAGYVYGLWLSGALIEARAAKKVLLLVGDTAARDTNLKNRIMAPVFGDGGSATLLEYSDTAKPMYFDLGSDGKGFESVIQPSGGARIPLDYDEELYKACTKEILDAKENPWIMAAPYMNGEEVFNFTMDVVPNHINTMLGKVNLAPENISYLVLHQANKQIMELIADKTNFPLEKVPTNAFSLYGNLASASIPSALVENFVDNKPLGKILLCGYGIGLAWGACLLEIEDWDCRKTLEFDEKGIKNSQEYVDYWYRKFQGE